MTARLNHPIRRMDASSLSREGRKPKSPDQALNDPTAGQFGEGPQADIKPDARKRR